MRKASRAVLVEGYMDVIGVYSAGIKEVVASCGTAITNPQVRAMHRHADTVVVNFDPDDAQNGLTFDEGEGRYRLTIERKPGDPSIGVRYGADRYELVDGASSYLELEEEKLHDYVTHQRKLPGNVLPP